MRRRPADNSRAELLRAETPLLPPLVTSGDAVRCALLFPNRYQVGMSSLAVHALYSLLPTDGLLCERVFAPEEGPAVSLETASPLSDFDVIAVSAPYELDWLALPAMLEAGGVPALASERSIDSPIVIVGGPQVTANPEPLAGIADVAFIGEIETIRTALQRALEGCRNDGKAACREALSAIPGVLLYDEPRFAPELGPDRARVTRQIARDIDQFQTQSAILTPHTEFGNRFLIEVGRGCGRGCGFCMAGCIYRPVRPRKPAGIIDACRGIAEHTRQIGLVGAALSDYPWIDELAPALVEEGFSISTSSLRAESATSSLLAALAASGQDSITIAPEAGDCSLRRAIGKPVPDEDLWRVCELAQSVEMRRIKLYFMIGLPGETDEQALEIAALTERLAGDFPRLRLIASVGPFVPKPHTALERQGMPPQSVLRRRLSAIETALSRLKGSEVRCGSARWATVQAALSRGGRELSLPLVEASREGGGYAAFRAALKRHGLSLEQYMAAPDVPEGELPWHVVDPVCKGGRP